MDRLSSKATPQGTLNYTYDAAGHVASIASANTNGASISYTYDDLNRLSVGNSTSGPYNNNSICGSYDSFGNRTDQQIVSSGGFTNSPGSSCQPASSSNVTFNLSQYYTTDGTANTSDNGKNQLTGTSSSSIAYNDDGTVKSDGTNQYLYDAEGRICAVMGDPATGYIYDAEGTRVGKVTLNSFSCSPSAYQQISETYAIGQGGEEMSMFDSSGNWQRSNVYGAGRLLATYDTNGLHFQITDALGTRRMQVSGNYQTAGVPELDYQSLPFGDVLQPIRDPNALSGANDATPLHFTGKERDAESGNDYFGARYYASSMGRWMSPDYSDEPDPVPNADYNNPQSLNLYAYVGNNPLTDTDPDGHKQECDGGSVINGVFTIRCVVSPDNPPPAGPGFTPQTPTAKAVQAWAGQHPMLTRMLVGPPCSDPKGCISLGIVPWGMPGGPGGLKLMSLEELKALLGAQQTGLLRQLLGKGLKGAEEAMENPSVPQGLTRQALEI